MLTCLGVSSVGFMDFKINSSELCAVSEFGSLDYIDEI
jgi:hypothetical protein